MQNMRRMSLLAVLFAILGLAIVCFSSPVQQNDTAIEPGPEHPLKVIETIKRLKKAANSMKPYFGHQDDLLYGQNWWMNDKDTSYIKSDTYTVTGKYPYVLGLDISLVELGKEKNRDGVSFSKMREAALRHYYRGGIITISWHISNIKTEGPYNDCSTGELVKEVLRDSTLNAKYMVWLKRVADYFETYTDSEGIQIPILFRPFHECNINGHWWAGKLCSNEDYKELWRLTFEYLVNQRGLNNLIWVYSPYKIGSTKELIEKYPGDRFVDIIGYEKYQVGALTYELAVDRFAKGLQKGIDITINFAEKHHKMVALTETGFPGIPYDKWWTEALGRGIKKKKIAYVLVWRNGTGGSHYHGPCPKSKSSADFMRMVNENKIQLLDIK